MMRFFLALAAILALWSPVSAQTTTVPSPGCFLGAACQAGSLAIGGATIGTDALAVTGTATISGTFRGLGLVAADSGFRVNQGADAVLTSSLNVKNTGAIGFSSTTNALNAADVTLFRDAANTLALRNGTARQRFNLYNTYTDGSNYANAFIGFVGNDLGFGALNAGTGPAGALKFYAANANRWDISTGGHFIAAADNTYDIGASGATRPRNGYFGSAVVAYAGTAIPAGGTAGAGLKVSSTANFGVFFGSGAPSLSAAKGSLYMRSDGTGVNDRMYVNTDGSTTWTAVVTVGANDNDLIPLMERYG